MIHACRYSKYSPPDTPIYIYCRNTHIVNTCCPRSQGCVPKRVHGYYCWVCSYTQRLARLTRVLAPLHTKHLERFGTLCSRLPGYGYRLPGEKPGCTLWCVGYLSIHIISDILVRFVRPLIRFPTQSQVCYLRRTKLLGYGYTQRQGSGFVGHTAYVVWCTR